MIDLCELEGHLLIPSAVNSTFLTGQAKAEQIRVFLEDAVKLAGIRHKQVANVLASTQLRHSSLGKNGCPENIPILIYPHYEYGILKNFLRKTVAGGSDEHSAVVGSAKPVYCCAYFFNRITRQFWT